MPSYSSDFNIIYYLYANAFVRHSHTSSLIAEVVICICIAIKRYRMLTIVSPFASDNVQCIHICDAVMTCI